MNLAIKVDLLNVIMLFMALVCSVLFPFKTFIFSFAILGPLHYLTEINWLEKKQYFTEYSKTFKITTIIATLLFILPFAINLLALDPKKLTYLTTISNGSLLGIIGLSIGFFIWKKLLPSLTLMVLMSFLAFVFNNYGFLETWVGVFIPTIIHVYVFTAVFMLYGALKSGSRVGLFNVFILILIPFIIVYLNVNELHYNFSSTIKSVFLNNNFHFLNAKISELIGDSDGSTFFFYEAIDLKIQIFIAFAYSYHYLNWFSKTTVIGWHRNIKSKKIILMIVFWVTAMVLYYIDFKLGFITVLFFSTLHVMLELPLVVKTFKGIITELFLIK